MPVMHNGLILPQAPDYAVLDAGWYPMHRGRISDYGMKNNILALFYHTPEESADNIEVTPNFFRQDPKINGSVGGTHYYSDNDGDMYQMARDYETPNAQGVRSSGSNPNVRLPRPSWWKPEYISYNTCGLSIEMEGRAATLHKTMIRGGDQWNSVVHWAAEKSIEYGIPTDLDHHVGHGVLSTDRTDPGALFPWKAFLYDVNSEITHISKSGYGEYVVRSGDTLGEISIRLGVPLEKLAAANGIENLNDIKVGQVLKLPDALKIVEPVVPPVSTLHKKLPTSDLYDAVTLATGLGPVSSSATSVLSALYRPTNRMSGDFEIHEILVKRKK